MKCSIVVLTLVLGCGSSEPASPPEQISEPATPVTPVTVAPSQPPAFQAVTPPAFTRYDGDGWSLAVPSNWQRHAPLDPAIVVDLADTADLGGFRSNINMSQEPFAGTLQDFATGDMSGDPNITVVSRAASSAGGHPSVDMESIVSAGSTNARTLHTFVVAHGRGYVLTCIGAAETFETLRPTCRAIVSSLAFTQ